MGRPKKIATSELLARLANGQKPEEIAASAGMTRDRLFHILREKRIRFKARTSYQLVAMFARGEINVR